MIAYSTAGGCYGDYFYPIRTYYDSLQVEDDIISPLWDFIKIDQRKQARLSCVFLNKPLQKRLRMNNKLMPSRSGYRGVKVLKRQ